MAFENPPSCKICHPTFQKVLLRKKLNQYKIHRLVIKKKSKLVVGVVLKLLQLTRIIEFFSQILF